MDGWMAYPIGMRNSNKIERLYNDDNVFLYFLGNDLLYIVCDLCIPGTVFINQ